MPAASPIFVIGVSGSFAQQLTRALGRHSELHSVDARGALVDVLRLVDAEEPAPETVAAALSSFADRVGVAGVQTPATSRFKRGSRSEHRATVHAALAGAFEESAVEHGKTRCVVLADDCINFLPALGDVCPQSLFVHVLRDPREIALESLEQGLEAGGAAERWLTEAATMLAWASEHPERAVTVASERLTDSPAVELTRLCLAGELRDEASEMAQALAAEPAMRRSPPRWPQSLSVPALESVESLVQPTLTLLGYAPAEPRTFEALRQAAPLVEDLRAQVEALRAEAAEKASLQQEVELLRERVSSLTRRGADAASSPGAPTHGATAPVALDEAPTAHDALVAENARLRLRASRYDELLAEMQILRAKVAQHEPLRQELRALRLKAEGYETISEEAKKLRSKAGRYDVDELQRLRFKAREYDGLTHEVRSLRFKAAKYDEVIAENMQLRFKARRYDKLRKWLAPLRPFARLVRRVREH